MEGRSTHCVVFIGSNSTNIKGHSGYPHLQFPQLLGWYCAGFCSHHWLTVDKLGSFFHCDSITGSSNRFAEKNQIWKGIIHIMLSTFVLKILITCHFEGKPMGCLYCHKAIEGIVKVFIQVHPILTWTKWPPFWESPAVMGPELTRNPVSWP